MKVLLVVDVQKDFCGGEALEVPEGDQVVDVINDLMLKGGFDLVIATKDWHPANHKSFAVNHPGKQVFDEISLQGLPQRLWPVHCVQNSEGSQFHPDLKSHLIDQIVYKGTDPEIDSYSGFFDNGRKKETELRTVLEEAAQKAGIPKEQMSLTVCGLATDYCVGFTARDSVSLGFKTELVVDGCRGVNLSPGDDTRMLQELRECGVSITESRALLPSIPVERTLPPSRSAELSHSNP